MKKNSIFQRIIDILVFLILCTYFGNRNIQFVGLSIYQLLIFLLSIFIIIKILNEQKVYLKLLKHFKWYLIFVIFCTISLIWTINMKYSLNVIRQLIINLIFLFDLSLLIDSKEKLIVFVKKYAFSLVYALIMLLLFERDMSYYGRSIGFNRNLLAISYAFGIAFLVLLIQKKYTKKKYGILMFVYLIIIFVTGSRKGILLAFILLIGFLITNMGFNKRKIFRNFLIIIVVLFSSFVVIKSNSELDHRMQDLFNSFQGETVQDKSVIERNYYKKTAIELFKKEPIIGIGIYGFAGYMEKIGYSHIAYAHTNWLELLCTVGIIGFILYYSQYFFIFKKSIKIFDNKNIETYLPLVSIITLFIFEYGFVSYFELIIQVILFILYKLIEFNEKRV